jgi:hypothetical protein
MNNKENGEVIIPRNQNRYKHHIAIDDATESLANNWDIPIHHSVCHRSDPLQIQVSEIRRTKGLNG